MNDDHLIAHRRNALGPTCLNFYHRPLRGTGCASKDADIAPTAIGGAFEVFEP